MTLIDIIQKSLVFLGVFATITIVLWFISKLCHRNLKTSTIFAISLGLSAGISPLIYNLIYKLFKFAHVILILLLPILFSILAIAVSSQAKPIKVEQILSHKKELQMDLSLSYTSINKSSGKSQLIYLQK